MKFPKQFVSFLALAALALLPVTAAAQSTLATAEASAFVGSWTLNLDSPQGPFEQTLDIKDMDGKVGAALSSPIAPLPTEITDITKSGSDLVLRFAGDFQGQPFTAAITLTPESDSKAKVSFNVMDGMFIMEGSGTRK